MTNVIDGALQNDFGADGEARGCKPPPAVAAGRKRKSAAASQPTALERLAASQASAAAFASGGGGASNHGSTPGNGRDHGPGNGRDYGALTIHHGAVKRGRKNLGLTVEQFSLALGVSSSSIFRYESVGFPVSHPGSAPRKLTLLLRWLEDEGAAGKLRLLTGVEGGLAVLAGLLEAGAVAGALAYCLESGLKLAPLSGPWPDTVPPPSLTDLLQGLSASLRRLLTADQTDLLVSAFQERPAPPAPPVLQEAPAAQTAPPAPLAPPPTDRRAASRDTIFDAKAEKLEAETRYLTAEAKRMEAEAWSLDAQASKLEAEARLKKAKEALSKRGRKEA
ncbi:MAG: hypothetical protein LBU12_05980 [Deltaproteobacteria bacterium]|jgi:hypothetical protein|nr:hypothetical protein [Deltaproteobacteria bacterium]